MHLDEALERGYGLAHKVVRGNRYRVERLGEMHKVILFHRSGVRKELDFGVFHSEVVRRYGANGWKPGS